MDGVVPLNVKAALLPDRVSDVNDGVDDTVNAPDEIVKLVPVRSVNASPFMVKVSPVSKVNPPKAVIKPVEVRVDNLVSAKEVNPETVSPEESTAADVILAVAPIETLPVVVRVDSLVSARDEKPETTKPDCRLPRDVTLAVPPIPTLPDTFKDDPMPRKPLKNPVPCTLKL